MPQRRDKNGRFASGTGARSGQIKGTLAKKNRRGASNALQNVSGVARSTGTTVRANGVSIGPRGQKSIAGRPVGGGTARTAIQRGVTRGRAQSRARFKAMPASERRQVTRGQRRFLGPVR